MNNLLKAAAIIFVLGPCLPACSSGKTKPDSEDALDSPDRDTPLDELDGPEDAPSDNHIDVPADVQDVLDVPGDDMPPPDPLALTTVGHEFFNGSGKIFLRGVGKLHDMDDLSGWWSGPGESFIGVGRWETDADLLTQRMDAHMGALHVWGGNMLRVFVAVNWWWEDRINPRARYGEGPDQDMSYRDYFELLAQRAALQEVYIVFCPYQLRSYMDGGGGGIPVAGGMDSVGESVLNEIYAEDPTYLEPTRLWWRSVIEKLGHHPNVIFETWNEPDSDDDAVKEAWFVHQIEMYKTIRENSDNVVLIAWHMGAIPTWQEELSWIPDFHNRLRDDLGSEPSNVAYDFHAYRFRWNFQWGTDYASVYGQLTSANWLPQTRSAGVDVPVLCAETGMGLNSPNLDDEIGWWDGLLRSFNELDVGYNGYYWSPSGWMDPDLGMFDPDDWWPAGQPAPTPNRAGQVFLDNIP